MQCQAALTQWAEFGAQSAKFIETLTEKMKGCFSTCLGGLKQLLIAVTKIVDCFRAAETSRIEQDRRTSMGGTWVGVGDGGAEDDDDRSSNSSSRLSHRGGGGSGGGSGRVSVGPVESLARGSMGSAMAELMLALRLHCSDDLTQLGSKLRLLEKNLESQLQQEIIAFQNMKGSITNAAGLCKLGVTR